MIFRRKTAKLRKLNVIEEYAGHCIGKNLHDNPLVLHYANSADYGLMKPGMAFTLGFLCLFLMSIFLWIFIFIYSFFIIFEK